MGCELLSNFLYFCSRNNSLLYKNCNYYVVNCSQIFCTFAAETTRPQHRCCSCPLWIALKFFVLLQPKQLCYKHNWTDYCCELLSNFLYFCSRNNRGILQSGSVQVVNCSQIFCTFAAETTIALYRLSARALWIALKFFVLLQPKQQKDLTDVWHVRCELLSNFLYFCSRNN